MNSNLGDFFKAKEMKDNLKPKGWFVIRLDGKAFHTFSKSAQKPFDITLSEAMRSVTKQLCAEVQNVKMAYTQSDEISLVISDLDSEKTSLWFDGDIQKTVSVSASIATAHFNRFYKHPDGRMGYFDSRVFRLENEEEVQNYLKWRQIDSIKNAITLISLKHFSDKQIHGKHSGEKIEMIESKGDRLSNYLPGLIQGFSIRKSFKKVPFTNPKNKVTGLVDRSFWQDACALDFKKESFIILINKE